MTIMVTRTSCLSLLMVLLSACAQHQSKLMEANQSMENRNAELIRDQQALIEDQTAKIDQLTALQQELSLTLDDVEEKLTFLQEFTAEKLATAAPARKLAPVPVITVQEEDNEPVSNRELAEKTVVGRIEWVWIDLFDHIMKARVDTGVLVSTLSADNIQPFERNGEKWVSFSLKADPKHTKYEAPVVRYTKSKQVRDDADRRPIIKLVVRLGELLEESEFTLTTKNGTSYPVQLGRSFLRDIAVVDVSKKYIFAKDKLEQQIQNALTQANQK